MEYKEAIVRDFPYENLLASVWNSDTLPGAHDYETKARRLNVNRLIRKTYLWSYFEDFDRKFLAQGTIRANSIFLEKLGEKNVSLGVETCVSD